MYGLWIASEGSLRPIFCNYIYWIFNVSSVPREHHYDYSDRLFYVFHNNEFV